MWTMKKIEYTGYSTVINGNAVYKVTVCLENYFNKIGIIKLVINAGRIKIVDDSYEFLNQEKSTLDILEAFEKLEKIKFPTQTKFIEKGCDGYGWKLTVDDTKYEGYLTFPKFLDKVLKIIKYDEICEYAERKAAAYIKG